MWISFHLMSVLAPPGFIALLFERWWMDEPLNDCPSYSVLTEVVRQSNGSGAANINKLCRHQTSVRRRRSRTDGACVLSIARLLLVGRPCWLAACRFPSTASVSNLMRLRGLDLPQSGAIKISDHINRTLLEQPTSAVEARYRHTTWCHKLTYDIYSD